MNLTDNFKMKCLSGCPVFIGEDVCAIYPATLREIAALDDNKFNDYLRILTIDKPVVSDKENPERAKFINSLSTFQYFLVLVESDPVINSLAKEAFRFFTHESVIFSIDPVGITIGPPVDKHIIKEEEFLDIQQCLRKMYWLEEGGEDTTIRANDSEAVKRLKIQMQKNHEKLRLAKAKSKSGGGSDLGLSDLIASVPLGNCGLNINSVWDITYYAFHDQLKRIGWYEQFDINNRAMLAGAKLKKKDRNKHWIRSIDSNDK